VRKLVINGEDCKACGYCIHFCPKGALSFSEQLNAQSYTPVQAEEDACILCGTCYTVCPDMVFSIIEIKEDAAMREGGWR